MIERRRPHRDRPNVIEIVVRIPADKADAVRTYAGRISRRRQPITRDEVVARIQDNAHLMERFGVKSLALFGSVVRNDAKPTSDIDLMVSFHPGHPGGLFRFVELKHALEGLLGRPVDLITSGNIKPRLRRRIMAECMPVYGEEACEI
jgi:predicted nucleotidyltransferase